MQSSSLGKQFVSTASMMLVEEKKLSRTTASPDISLMRW